MMLDKCNDGESNSSLVNFYKGRTQLQFAILPFLNRIIDKKTNLINEVYFISIRTVKSFMSK